MAHTVLSLRIRGDGLGCGDWGGGGGGEAGTEGGGVGGEGAYAREFLVVVTQCLLLLTRSLVSESNNAHVYKRVRADPRTRMRTPSGTMFCGRRASSRRRNKRNSPRRTSSLWWRTASRNRAKVNVRHRAINFSIYQLLFFTVQFFFRITS